MIIEGLTDEPMHDCVRHRTAVIRRREWSKIHIPVGTIISERELWARVLHDDDSRPISPPSSLEGVLLHGDKTFRSLWRSLPMIITRCSRRTSKCPAGSITNFVNFNQKGR